MDGTYGRRPRALATDEGFGLVEVVVAMLLLTAISLAALPVLAHARVTSAQNSTTATATQLASRDLESARASATSCLALKSYAASAALTTVDGRGQSYAVSRSAITCPATFPATLAYVATISVRGKAISTLNTTILVTR